MKFSRIWLTAVLLASCLTCWAQQKRKIIIDQDAGGPAGTDQQSMLLLIQSPQTDVLGITVVTGDQWLNAEVAHTLRMLELIGRTDIPVFRGAEYPLVRRKEETELWEQMYGSVTWLGAWTPKFYHPPNQLGEMPEGAPTTKAADEDAAHFLVRMVRKYPNEITIYAGDSLAARYIGKYAQLYGEYNYLWDELASAAWLDPSVITKKETRFMDVDLDRGAGYGNILTWVESDKPKIQVQPVEIQVDLDTEKFYNMFVDLLKAPTPKAH